MRRTALFIPLALALTISVRAALQPSIGLARAPLPADTICAIPLVEQAFEESGPQPGTSVPDFTLHRRDGSPFTLSDALTRTPVLLVAGSFSCPVFRASIPTLNALADRYRDRLAVVVVYVLEPHPAVDISPYFGVENLTQQNRYADILVRQPRTYRERLALVDSLHARFALTTDLVVDGPCNEWWSAFGRAPNNAMLIDSEGVVASYHGWFDREPLDIADDVARLLGEEGEEDEDSIGGGFSVILAGAPDSTAPTGTTFVYYATLTTTDDRPVEVLLERVVNDLPDGWASSLCTDVCQPPLVGTDRVVVHPGLPRTIAVHLYTDMRPGDGRVSVRVTNSDSTANSFTLDVSARTTATAAVPGHTLPVVRAVQGGRGLLRVELGTPALRDATVSLYDVAGCLAQRGRIVAGARRHLFERVSPGAYVIVLAIDGARTPSVVVTSVTR
jgi:hypothetical protein